MSKPIAFYLRLSSDDGTNEESNSIASQRGILSNYIASDPSLASAEVLEFPDDGWSGTNFERPQVKKLLDLAKRGGVRCILVKDLSRWGRNYIEVCEYLEQIFPFLGIRFISVNDRYDSDNFKGRTAPMDIAFSSIMHDVFSKELSFKIRQSYIAKAEKGEHVNSQAPFGYKKSDTAKHKLVIDEDAAAIVRRIFNLAAEGMPKHKIVSTLNSEGVPTPLMYRRSKGLALPGQAMTNAFRDGGEWSPSKVNKILRNETYIGVLVSCKSKSVKPGSRKKVKQPESEWIKVPDAHEAIISKDVFICVSEGFKEQAKPQIRGRVNPFAHKIRCAYCGRPLRYKQRLVGSYYLCDGIMFSPGARCSKDKVLLEDLKATVLATVTAEARKVLDEREYKKSTVPSPCNTDTDAMELKQAAAGLESIKRRGLSLYEEYVEGKIDKSAYIAKKAAYAEEAAGLESRSDVLTARIVSIKELLASSENKQDNEPLLKRIADGEEWTDDVMALVECVLVSGPKRIEVRLDFGDTNIGGGV